MHAHQHLPLPPATAIIRDTGEDGYEVSLPASDALRVTHALLAAPGVLPAGACRSAAR